MGRAAAAGAGAAAAAGAEDTATAAAVDAVTVALETAAAAEETAVALEASCARAVAQSRIRARAAGIGSAELGQRVLDARAARLGGAVLRLGRGDLLLGPAGQEVGVLHLLRDLGQLGLGFLSFLGQALLFLVEVDEAGQ